MIDKPPISEEKFCDILNFIHNSKYEEEKVNDLLGEIYGCRDFYPCLRYEHALVNLLKHLMRDEDNKVEGYRSWIDYFMYDYPDFGAKSHDGMVTDKEGNNIPLNTPSDLYKLLVEDNFKQSDGDIKQ